MVRKKRFRAVIRFMCLLGLVISTFLSGTGTEAQTFTSRQPARFLSPEELIQLEDEVFQEVNDYRVSQGLGPLTKSEVIREIALRHSQDMAQGAIGFGHDGFKERARQVQVQLDPNINAFAENVFAISSNYPGKLARAITLGWLKSSHHHKNIVGKYSTSGLAMYQSSDGVIYVTQFFAGAGDE